MCGIAGIIARNNQKVSIELLEQMTDIIKYRGPDGEGHYINENGQVGLGHRRLSIIDLTEDGAQPMKREGLVITYNGEIYNYIELRSELIRLGHVFSTQTDTEIIMASYKEWGKDCVNRLNGMWAFVIYDEQNQEVFCSRDRYGIKPFYYYSSLDYFFFASEIKQLTVTPHWRPILNQKVAIEFLEYGRVNHTKETFFEGVIELRGGEAITIDLSTSDFSVYRYYQPIRSSESNTHYKDEKTLVKEFKELMIDAVSIALRADVKVGSALSGGLDSSIITSISSRKLKEQNKAQNQECVSACFHDTQVDESFFVDKLVDFTGVKVHKVYPAYQELKENLKDVVWHQDEPITSMSMFAQFSVFKEAQRNNVVVMLDGQGADEILAGYENFYAPLLKAKRKKSSIHALGFLLNLAWRNPHSIRKYFNIFFQLKEDGQHLVDRNVLAKHKSLLKNDKPNDIFGYSYQQLYESGLHALLRFEDRNSMASSIESRVPFLDYRVVDFCLNLPDNLKIKRAIRKHILRAAFKDDLPKEISKRYKKYGFPTPQETWTYENLEDFYQLLQQSWQILENIGLLNKSYINNLLIQSKKPSKSEIWKGWRLIFFAQWFECFEMEIKMEEN